jgi:hypothetical protein
MARPWGADAAVSKRFAGKELDGAATGAQILDCLRIF